MRFIEKQSIRDLHLNPNLIRLNQYICNQVLAQPDPLHPRYDGITGQIKEDLINELLREQRGLCCYCMQTLDRDKCHIEHLAPQSCYLNEEASYYNLFLSCGSHKEAKLHCGIFKANNLIPKVMSFYNPSTQQSPKICQELFKYNAQGEILPRQGFGNVATNKSRRSELNSMSRMLQTTIETLNLNCRDLTTKRAAIAETIITLPNNVPELQGLLVSCTTGNVNGNLDSFCEVAIYFLEDKMLRIADSIA